MPQQANELTEPLVKWIESEMARQGWNQAELGRRATLGPDVISRMISRETAPDPDTIKAIAGAFGITLQDLQIAAIDDLRDGQLKRLGRLQERRSGVGRTAPSSLTAELEEFMGLVRDALMGAVERALARDELEHTRKGRFVLGNAFMDLALQLEDHGVEVRELRKVARELQKMGQP